MPEKLMTMKEAVREFVRPGDTLFFAGMQHGEPVAAAHEIIRQGINHLTVIAVLNESRGLMVGEGLVDKLIMATFGDIYIKRKCYTVVKARKNDSFPQLIEFSHFGLCLALMAGEMGIPFMPTHTLLGSDVEKYNDYVGRTHCPFTGETVAAVQAINPDVGIIHVQRADAVGNAQKWGSLGLDRMGINACRRIIVTTEEIVSSNVIRKSPNLTIVPGARVSAVVEEPWGSYPIHLTGCYGSDVMAYLKETEGKGEEGYETFMKEYVYGVKDRQGFIEKVKRKKGEGYFDKLKVKESDSAGSR